MLSRATSFLHAAALARLIRLPLALMVVLTAVTGAMIGAPHVAPLPLWALAWGVFLLAAGSSALNQVQERITDALMRRTAGRPLACGQLSPGAGTLIGLLCGSGGLAVLAIGPGTVPALLGLAALAWYLTVYTPLKRASSLAVIAGTPCGAIPPLIGWLAAGGTLPSPQPLALALFMVLWQVPHYWLLALPDRMELQAAGFRVLPPLSDRQLLAVSHRWILGLALISLLLPALDLPVAPLLQGLLIGLALAMAFTSGWLLQRDPFTGNIARKLRRLLHLYLGVVLLILLIDRLL